MWRDEEEVLERVRRRAREIRTRRHATVVAVLASVVGLAGVVSAGLASTGRAGRLDVVAPSTSPATTTGRPAVTGPASTVPSPPTSVPARAHPPASTTAPPPGPTTTLASLPYDECTPADFVVSIELDRTTVVVGEPVSATVKILNASTKTCPSGGRFSERWAVAGQEGDPLRQRPALAFACDFSCAAPPGDLQQYTVCWDQADERELGERAQPGSYTVEVGSGQLSATASFEIVEGPPTPTTTAPGRCP